MKRVQKAEFGTGLLLLLMGSCMLIGAGFLGKEAHRFAKGAYRVDAKVVSVATTSTRTSEGRRKTQFIPTVSFRTNTGQTIQPEASWRSRHKFVHGEILSLLVDSANPYIFKLGGYWNIWGYTTLLAFLGGGISVVALSLCMTSWKKK